MKKPVMIVLSALIEQKSAFLKRGSGLIAHPIVDFE